MPKKSLNIILVGCGKMGSAMMHSWLKSNLVNHAFILDPHEISSDLKENERLTHINNAQNLGDFTPDIIILAVKPQIMHDVCSNLSPYISNNTPIMSIAAGQSIQSIRSHLSQENQPVIRVMPNTPAAIGKGISAAISSHGVSHETKTNVSALLQATGEIIWLKDENQMDAVTALSGSGPAYIFYLIEVMTKSGIKIGLSEEQSSKLARQTVIGSARLAEEESNVPASTLRENVTSKGGTTEAALEKLMDGRMQDIFDEALLSAKKRSIELS